MGSNQIHTTTTSSNNNNMPLATTSTSSKHDDDAGVLLSLPQSDLTGNNNKGVLQKADLVLFQLPQNTELQEDFYAGNCQLLANEHAASLVSPSSSYRLVTVGTSNTLVVWKSREESSSSKVTDDEASPPPAKKQKSTATKTTTACRLIQPGGSGASFLIGQEHPVQPSEVLQWFEQQKELHKQQQNGGSNIATIGVPTSALANHFQCSELEMRVALWSIPSVVGIGTSSDCDGNEILW